MRRLRRLPPRQVNLCPNNVATGIHRDGGFAEYAAFPARRAHRVPDALDPRHGAFCEPLACTLHGVDIGAPRPGERVLVIGGGVIGLLALQLASLAGAETMLLTRTRTSARWPDRLGAAATAATPDGGPRDLAARAPTCVLECAGVPETVAEAPSLTRAGGRIVVIGVLHRGRRCRSSRSTCCSARSSSFRLHQPLHPGAGRRAYRLGPGRGRAADLAHHPARRRRRRDHALGAAGRGQGARHAGLSR